MQGKFVSNLILLVILNLLIKPFYILGIDAEIQNRVGSEDYGMYFALLNFTFLFNVLLDLGITNFNNRAVSRKGDRLRDMYPDILGLKSLLLLLYLIVSLGIAFSLGFSRTQFEMLWVLFLNQFFVSMLLYLRSNLGALQLFVKDSIVSVLDRFLLILLFSVILWGGVVNEPIRIEWLVYGQTGAYGVTLLVAWLFQPASVRYKLPRFKKQFSIRIIKRSIPYAMLIMLMMIYNRIDSVMLERMLSNGREEAGIYAQGFRLLDAGSMFAMLFAVLLLPMFSKMIRQRENLHPLIHSSTRLILVFSIPLAAITCFYAREILEILYDSVTAVSVTSFVYLMISFLGICLTYVYGTLLTANGSLKQLNLMAVGGISVNVLLNYLLIPQYGAGGAAIATCITQLLTALIQFGIAQYIFRFSVFRELLIPVTVYTLTAVGISAGAYYFLQDRTWTPLFIYVLCLFAAWLTGNVRIRPFVEYIRNRN